MSPINIATDGFLCSPLGQATSGYICTIIVVSRPHGGGGGVRFRTVKSEPELESLMDQIIREDEEILAIIIGAVHSGIIK